MWAVSPVVQSMPRMEPDMNSHTDLIDRYFAIWNETDPARRRSLIANTWTEHANYLDPLMQGDGQAGIDAMIQGVQQRFPGHEFRRTSNVDSHHDRVRFSWELRANGGPVIVDGTDFAVIAADGRLQAVTGFLDHAPTLPSQS
jgi:SnoaL-like domain